MPDWVVAITHWRQEEVASDHLTKRGFNCYQPKYRERVRYRGRKVWRERMLLGRYLLVEMCERWVEIVYARPVKQVLMVDEWPMLARQCDVDQIRCSEVRGYILVAPRLAFKLDQKVFINNAGLLGAYQEIDERGICSVLVNLMGRLVPIHVAVDKLAAA